MTQGLKRVQIENYKKVKFVDITPRSDMIVISGKNAAGKSSIIDAIWEVLQGSSLSRSKENKVSVPIREGTEKSKITLEFDEYIVTKVITVSGPRLTVKNKKGFNASTPQKLIDDFIGDLSFDLSKFVNMGDKDRTKLLLDLVDITIDINGKEATLEEANDAYDGLFDDRAMANKEVQNKKGQLSAYDEVEKVEAVDVKELFEKKEGLIEDIQGQKDAKEEIGKIDENTITKQNRVTALEEKKATVEEEIKDLNSKIEANVKGKETINKTIEEFEDLAPALEEVKTKIAEVDEVNQKAAEYEKKQAAEIEVNMAQANSDNLTKKLDIVKDAIAKGLREVEMPIEGLSIDEKNLVTYNGKPLSQASQAEKLKIAIAIVKAQNPELKVIRVSEASLFDDDSMKYIEEITKEGWQIWAERVSDKKGDIGFYIEDGSIASIDGKDIEPQKPEPEKKEKKKSAKKGKAVMDALEGMEFTKKDSGKPEEKEAETQE